MDSHNFNHSCIFLWVFSPFNYCSKCTIYENKTWILSIYINCVVSKHTSILAYLIRVEVACWMECHGQP
jgi:hypothetical protein